MNKSIVSVLATTDKPEVAKWAAFICSHSNKPIRATFIMKDGHERSMTFVGKHEYNDMRGLDCTDSGIKMVKTKVARGMITVAELYTPEGVVGVPESFRPRTINLNTIVKMELA